MPNARKRNVSDILTDWLTGFRSEGRDFTIDDEFRLRYYRARKAWLLDRDPKRSKPTGLVSWAAWFEKHHGMELKAYRATAKRERYRELILDMEKRRFGWSPLDREKG